MRVCTDPQKLDRKNLTFGVSTKAFLLYKEYQIVWGFYLSLYFFTILFVILLLCSWNIYSEYVILEGIILFSVYDIRASQFDCCTIFINCKDVGLSFVLFPLLPEMVKATSFLLSFIQRYSPSKELLDWLEHAINKIVDRDTKSNVINLFIYILFISILY